MSQPAFDPSLSPGLAEDLAQSAGTTGPGDAELVRRTLDGDHDAFALLVARYQKRAFWTAFHVLGRIEDARDVAQEAFVRLYRSLHKYDFARSFYTWFYRIVMNLAIDQLRKHRSARATSLDETLQASLSDAHTSVSSGLERDEQQAQVWQVLQRIDARFRAVMVLRDIQGLDCRQIAPILRITHATVRWRLHRGRQIFRELWERLQQQENGGGQ